MYETWAAMQQPVPVPELAIELDPMLLLDYDPALGQLLLHSPRRFDGLLTATVVELFPAVVADIHAQATGIPAVSPG